MADARGALLALSCRRYTLSVRLCFRADLLLQVAMKAIPLFRAPAAHSLFSSRRM